MGQNEIQVFFCKWMFLLLLSLILVDVLRDRKMIAKSNGATFPVYKIKRFVQADATRRPFW